MVLLTIQDAADRLQMSTGWIKKAIRKGELRAMKFGRCTRISEQDFGEYCAWKRDNRRMCRCRHAMDDHLANGHCPNCTCCEPVVKIEGSPQSREESLTELMAKMTLDNSMGYRR